jgi:hypothetical protein
MMSQNLWRQLLSLKVVSVRRQQWA